MSILLNKPMPYSEEAERFVLGCIILNNDLFHDAWDRLVPEDFLPRHQVLFRTMRELVEAGKAIDPVTLIDYLKASGDLQKAGDAAYIASLYDGVPRFHNIDSYIALVEDKSLRRQLIHRSGLAITLAYDESEPIQEILDRSQAMICDLGPKSSRTDWANAGDVGEAILRQAEEFAATGRKYHGLATGFYDLDNSTGGFEPGDLIIIGGRPSTGKSAMVGALSTGIAESRLNRKETGEPPVVAIFTLEMSKEQFISRMQCARAQVDSHKLRTGRLDSDEWRRLSDATQEIANLNIAIDDMPAISPAYMRNRLRKLKAKRGALGVVVVDYLQLMIGSLKYTNARERIEGNSKELKQIAREFNCTVIAVSTLSRTPDSRSDKRPMLSDLRESGQIEADADIVMFTYRDWMYNKQSDKTNAELIIGKQRNGPLDTVYLRFEERYCRFDNLTK